METVLYRRYVTDSLFVSGENKRLTVRYSELLKPEPKNERSGDEIVADIVKRHGLKLKGGKQN